MLISVELVGLVEWCCVVRCSDFTIASNISQTDCDEMREMARETQKSEFERNGRQPFKYAVNSRFAQEISKTQASAGIFSQKVSETPIDTGVLSHR
jgi:hypothetical protein